MTIPAEIHASLSPSARIRASVSAIARGDDEELKTLAETCPRKTYRQADTAFLDRMEGIIKLSMAVTADLQGLALDFFIAARVEDAESMKTALVVLASVEAAWQTILSDLGIDPEEMAKAAPPRHDAVGTLLGIAAGREHPEIIEAHLDAMRAHLATC